VPNRRSKFCNYTSLDTIFIEANMEQAKEAGAAPETEAAKAAKAANNMKTLCRFEFLEVRSSSERHVRSHKARLSHNHNTTKGNCYHHRVASRSSRCVYLST
jgi:hypothetical protein